MTPIGHKLISNLFLICLILLLVALRIKDAQVLPRCYVSKYASYKNNSPVIVKGFIHSEPVSKNQNTVFIFRASQVSFAGFSYSACGDILTYIRGRQTLDYGEELVLQGYLYKPFKGKVQAVMHIPSGLYVIKSGKNKGRWLKKLALSCKGKIEGIIFKYLSPTAAGITNAMIVGEKRNLSKLIYNAMIKTGTVHILVVSGFNVGIVTFIIILLLRLMRLKRRPRIYITIPLLILYCLASGASVPVVRATIMASVFLCAYLFKREFNLGSSLIIAAVCILWLEPSQFFDIGFQLSFASVIAIASLYPRLKSFLRVEVIKIKLIRFLLDTFLISLSAWLGTAGFIAYYFRIFSSVSILANIFIVPIGALMTICGFSLVFISLLCPALAPLFAGACEFLSSLLIHLNALFIEIPGAYLYFN